MRSRTWPVACAQASLTRPPAPLRREQPHVAYSFAASVPEQVAYFRASVQGLAAGGPWAGAYLHDTVLAVLAVESAAARGGGSDAELAAFREEASHALAPLGAQLRGYLELVLDEAACAREGAWPELCARRSALELLRAHYSGCPAVGELAAPELARLDLALRSTGDREGPVAPEWRLPGVPASHWWWWYPAPSRP